MDVLIGFTFSVIGKSTGLRVSPPVMHEAPGTAVMPKAKCMEADGVRCAIERVLKIQNSLLVLELRALSRSFTLSWLSSSFQIQQRF